MSNGLVQIVCKTHCNIMKLLLIEKQILKILNDLLKIASGGNILLYLIDIANPC